MSDTTVLTIAALAVPILTFISTQLAMSRTVRKERIEELEARVDELELALKVSQQRVEQQDQEIMSLLRKLALSGGDIR